MVPVMEFEFPPSPSMLALAMKGNQGLPADGQLPHIEARARRLERPVADYSRVCGFAEDSPLPLTFPDLLARGLHLAVLTHPAFPLRLLGIIHTEQRIQAHRAIFPSEPLSGRAWVSGPRPARRGGVFDLNTEIFARGDLVWSATTTILSRALPGDGAKRPRAQPTAFEATRSTVWPLAADLGRRYAAVSGDHNPVHLWPLTARPFGFKRPIVHGWWTLARVLAELDRDVPPACVLQASFHAPLPLPGRATFTAGHSANGAIHFEVRRKALCLAGTIVPA
jgi:acyl dehydratase